MITDPASFVALALLFVSIILALRLRSSRRRREALARRLAARANHPSSYRRAPQPALGPEIERIP